MPAPEAAHAVRGVIDEALRAKREGKKKTIVFNLSGHGSSTSPPTRRSWGTLQDYEYPADKIAEALRSPCRRSRESGMPLGRRQFLKLGAGATVAGLPRRARAQGKGKVRLAYLQLGWAGTEIIHKEDLLGKRGWQAEYSVVPARRGPSSNQLASKNVDAIDMSFALAAKAFEDGVPLKVTGVATAVLGAIVARKDAGLTRVEDLKGRKVAAVVGTSTFFDIRAFTLKGYGFDLQKETQIVPPPPRRTW